MRVLLLLASVAWAAPADVFQAGAYGGVGPAEPIYTQYLVGGWLGVGLGQHLRLEASGSFQDGLEQESDLGGFLRQEALLDPTDAVADRVLWTGELLLRIEPLRGKWAALQTSLADFAANIGVGGGVRAHESIIGETHLAPTGLLTAGLDFRPVDYLIVRLDSRVYAQWRRDETVGVGAEVLLGVGTRL